MSVIVATLVVGMGLTPGPARAESSGDPLTWRPCTTPTSEFECSQLVVPMDRHDPAGPTFTLAVARHRSTGTPERRIGTLVYIPGGPGGSGVSDISWVWMTLPEQLRQRFDLVSWDPRGTGNTTPAARPCSVDPDGSGGIDYRTGPISWRVLRNPVLANRSAFESDCQARNSGIAAHLGTNENVSDLDALRAALGEQQLTLWGVSFGTRIGAVYALTYPARVRAMLLDGPMDPTAGWPPPQYYPQAGVKGFEWVAHYFPAAGRQFQHVLDEVTTRPVRLTKTLWIDRFTVPQYIYQEEYDQTAYAKIAERVAQLHDAVFATGAAQRAARRDVTLHMGGSIADAFSAGLSIVAGATYCLDVAARPTIDGLLPLTRLRERQYGAAVASGVLNPALQCHGFTFPPDPIPLAANGSGPAVPLLVYGSTTDPRTPGRGITALAGAFPGARSVTYLGSQHMVWGVIASRCIARPGIAFLLSGAVPARDTTCANTYRKPGTLVP